MTQRPYADKLRHAIDTGQTGGKVSHPDPAAAPLGTDEEAAGTPLPGRLVDDALRQEIRRPPLPAAEMPRRPAVPFLAVVLGLIAIGLVVWLAA